MNYSKGDRVMSHPATDAWMMGDRYGTVVGRTRSYLHDTRTYGVKVKMDTSKRVKVFHPNNLVGPLEGDKK